MFKIPDAAVEVACAQITQTGEFLSDASLREALTVAAPLIIAEWLREQARDLPSPDYTPALLSGWLIWHADRLTQPQETPDGR